MGTVRQKISTLLAVPRQLSALNGRSASWTPLFRNSTFYNWRDRFENIARARRSWLLACKSSLSSSIALLPRPFPAHARVVSSAPGPIFDGLRSCFPLFLAYYEPLKQKSTAAYCRSRADKDRRSTTTPYIDRSVSGRSPRPGMLHSKVRLLTLFSGCLE